MTAVLDRPTARHASAGRRSSGTYRTRDEWIIAAIDKFWYPAFKQLGVEIPRTPLISVGYAPGQRAGGRVRGTCFIKEVSGGVNTIFITPEMADDLVQQLATIGHELIHVADNCRSGHLPNQFFDRTARALGFTSPITDSSNRTPELEGTLRQLASDLGPFAGRQFDLRKGQTEVGIWGMLRPGGHGGQGRLPMHGGNERNRWRRLDCRNKDCPISVQQLGEKKSYKARMTRAWAARIGTPGCPICGEHMKLEIRPEDLLSNQPEEL